MYGNKISSTKLNHLEVHSTIGTSSGCQYRIVINNTVYSNYAEFRIPKNMSKAIMLTSYCKLVVFHFYRNIKST